MIRADFVIIRALCALVSTFLILHQSVTCQERSVDINLDAHIIDDAISMFMRDTQAPGVAVALYYNGKPYTYNYGVADVEKKTPITADTIFEIASITKVFTATSLAWEVLAGRMKLQDPVIKYIGEVPKNEYPFANITLLQLATHTSSLPKVPPSKSKKDKSPYSPQEMLAWLKKWEPTNPIGSKYAYSNLGYGLIGYALATLSAISYEQIIAQEILQPLGMRSTFVTVPDSFKNHYATGYMKNGEEANNYPSTQWPGGGALRSTSHDMLQFLMANLGVKGPSHLLQVMQFAQKGYFRVNDTLVLGLGWQRITKNHKLQLIDKNGGVSGFSSYIGMVPGKKMGIVVMTNRGKVRVATLGRLILERLSEKQEKSPPKIDRSAIYKGSAIPL